MAFSEDISPAGALVDDEKGADKITVPQGDRSQITYCVAPRVRHLNGLFLTVIFLTLLFLLLLL
jgi:hypothetical protein